MWDLESEEQATFEKTKTPVKQIKTLDLWTSSKHSESDVSVTLEGTGQALWR